MDISDYNLKGRYGLQSKISDDLIDELIDLLDSYFNDRIDDFVVLEKTDLPYTMFSIRFNMYKYYNVILNYDRGAFGCAIINGDLGIDLENSQEWYDKADMNIFCQELEKQLELRIPDKFLEHYGWK